MPFTPLSKCSNMPQDYILNSKSTAVMSDLEAAQMLISTSLSEPRRPCGGFTLFCVFGFILSFKQSSNIPLA
jgi:hypothetical protein